MIWKTLPLTNHNHKLTITTMKHYCQHTAITLLAAMGLSSCTGANGEVWNATAIGTGVGAVLGAGIGALAGGSNHRAEGIAIGAAVGALLGGIGTNVWARSQVKARSAYATPAAYVQANKNQLNSRIGHARKANKALSDKRKSSARISADELAKIRNANAANAQLIDQDIATARKAMAEATPAEKAELKSQVNTLKQEKANMAAQVKALSAAQA